MTRFWRRQMCPDTQMEVLFHKEKFYFSATRGNKRKGWKKYSRILRQTRHLEW